MSVLPQLSTMVMTYYKTPRLVILLHNV
jgi:hypothetical protein